MMATTRCANNDARRYVNKREEFMNNNSTMYAHTIASTTGTDLYLVFSYGSHFPMYIAEEHEGHVNWYGNMDKYRITTTNHQSLCRPEADITWFDTNNMLVLMNYGITGLAAGKSI